MLPLKNQKERIKIGSTLKGIGSTYMDKTGRNGLRVGDISSPHFKEKYEKLKRNIFKFLIFMILNISLDEMESNWFDSLVLKDFLILIQNIIFTNQLKMVKRYYQKV